MLGGYDRRVMGPHVLGGYDTGVRVTRRGAASFRWTRKEISATKAPCAVIRHEGEGGEGAD